MTQPKTLTIIAHCPSDNTHKMANALESGAEKIGSVNVQLRSPFDCDHQTVLASDALILLTTENFGYMSGALKDFFDRIYYPCQKKRDQNEGKPYSLVIRAGHDGTGTQIAVEKIITGLSWKKAHANLLCRGEFDNHFIRRCHEHGQTLAALLDNELL